MHSLFFRKHMLQKPMACMVWRVFHLNLYTWGSMNENGKLNGLVF